MAKKADVSKGTAEKAWQKAKKIVKDKKDGQAGWGLTTHIMKNILGLNEEDFNTFIGQFIENKFLESKHSDFKAFLEDEMIASGFPPSVLPEIPPQGVEPEKMKVPKSSTTKIGNDIIANF